MKNNPELFNKVELVVIEPAGAPPAAVYNSMRMLMGMGL